LHVALILSVPFGFRIVPACGASRPFTCMVDV
jgi:hypothetical protein